MMNTASELKPSKVELPCDRCGRFGAFEFSGATLCAECYQLCGSCCPEFGADDLWNDGNRHDQSRRSGD